MKYRKKPIEVDNWFCGEIYPFNIYRNIRGSGMKMLLSIILSELIIVITYAVWILIFKKAVE